MKEWKDVVGYEGLYKVSSDGDVMHHNHILKISPVDPSSSWKRYMKIELYKRGKKRKSTSVHRLIANAFVPNPNNKPEVNHKNGIKTDNHAENLEWVTSSENRLHSYKVLGIKGAQFGKFGKDHQRSIPVNKYSIDGKLLEKYEGIRDAARKTGICASLISCRCDKNIICHGFIWKKAKK